MLLMPCSLISCCVTVCRDWGTSWGRTVAVPVTSIAGKVLTAPVWGGIAGLPPAGAAPEGASSARAPAARIPTAATPIAVILAAVPVTKAAVRSDSVCNACLLMR